MAPTPGNEVFALVFAFGSALSFSTASVVFARFSKEISSAWMNTFKAVVCLVLMLLAVLVTRQWAPMSGGVVGALLGSGAIGLGVGDLFLLAAYAHMGASRTLMVFGFQPLLIGIASAPLFGQTVAPLQAVAICFFILCLFLLSFERYRRDGRWEIRGLAFALIGVTLDNSGVLLSRWSFENAPGLESFQANVVRTVGALLVFAIYSRLKPIGLVRHFRALSPRDRLLVLTAAFFGTFLSLSFYLFAVKNGHLASVSAVVLTGPVLAAAVECAVQKRTPSPSLVGGMLCLFAGMGIAFFA